MYMAFWFSNAVNKHKTGCVKRIWKTHVIIAVRERVNPSHKHLQRRYLAPQDILDFGYASLSFDRGRPRKDSQSLFGRNKKLLNIWNNTRDKINDKLVLLVILRIIHHSTRKCTHLRSEHGNRTLQPPQRVFEGFVSWLRFTDDGRQLMPQVQKLTFKLKQESSYPMHQCQDHSL